MYRAQLITRGNINEIDIGDLNRRNHNGMKMKIDMRIFFEGEKRKHMEV